MRWIPRTVLHLGAAFTLASCGAAGGTTAGIASLDSGRAATTVGGPGGVSPVGGGEDRFYAFAKCMRGKGINVPDPEPGGGPVKIGPGTGIEMGDPKFEEAQTACAKDLGGTDPATGDPKAFQEFQDQALAFAKCMRENGIDMPDPTFGAGGRVEQRLDDVVSPDDPRFQEASKKCESRMPGRTAGRSAGARP